MSLIRHDFTHPPRLPPEIKTRLATWLQRSHAIFAESLKTLGLSLSAQSLDQDTVWPLPTLEIGRASCRERVCLAV